LGERQRFSRSAPLPVEHFIRKLNVSHYRARIPASARLSASRVGRPRFMPKCARWHGYDRFRPATKVFRPCRTAGPFKVDLMFEKIASFSRRAIVGV
jgi:hypothetical protein